MKKKGVYSVLICLLAAALLSCGDYLLEFAKNRERGKAGLEERSVQVGTHRVVYLEGGKGETLLLVHGFGGDKDNWTRMAKYLTSNFRVIAPDLPGFGESDRKDTENYNIQNQTTRLEDFAKKLGIERFHLAGNSMGGWISAWYAVRYPQKVISLILINSAGVTSPEKSEHAINIAKGYNALLVNNVDDYDRLIKFIFVNPPYIPGPLKKHFAAAAVRNRAFNERIYDHISKEKLGLESHLKKITAPTFIVWGDTDRVIHPSSVGVFAGGIANSKSLIFEKCGHLPMLEKPQETAEAVTGFIRGIGQ